MTTEPVLTIDPNAPRTIYNPDPEHIHVGPNPQHPQRVTLRKLLLLHDFVLVRPLAAPLKKAGGTLFMPENAGSRERNSRGIVLRVGPGDYNTAGTAKLPMSVSEGDLVFFGKYAGTEEEFEGETVLAMRETECRLRVFAGDYQVIEHEDRKLNHLVEDWCDVCYGDPDAEAKARLEAERDAAREARRAGELTALLETQTVPLVDVDVPRRPCAARGDAGEACLGMQTLFTPVPGDGEPVWIGKMCGHRHPAGIVEP